MTPSQSWSRVELCRANRFMQIANTLRRGALALFIFSPSPCRVRGCHVVTIVAQITLTPLLPTYPSAFHAIDNRPLILVEASTLPASTHVSTLLDMTLTLPFAYTSRDYCIYFVSYNYDGVGSLKELLMSGFALIIACIISSVKKT